MANGELVTERNTSRVERLVRKAAAKQFGRGKARPVYEHGHWWVLVYDKEEARDVTFDVVDAEPGISDTGLDFEQVD
jgi:hypothetical protein